MVFASPPSANGPTALEYATTPATAFFLKIQKLLHGEAVTVSQLAAKAVCEQPPNHVPRDLLLALLEQSGIKLIA